MLSIPQNRGKIFIGGLASETTECNYDLTDS